MPAHATSLKDLNIREVHTESTDVFEVLTNLGTAQTALNERDYTTAKQGFENALMHDPNLSQARAGLRRTLIAMGDIKAAYTLMDDPQSSDGLIIRARLGLIENTTKALIDALQIKSDPRLWTLLGQFQDMEGQSMTARQSYAMAGLAGARPGLADNNIGQSFLTEGAFESALKAFSKAAKADPFDVQFDNNRRRVLINLGETHQAIAGLPPERAAIFLEQAADQAMVDREVKLAQYLYRKSLDLSPRYNPKVAEKLELAKH